MLVYLLVSRRIARYWHVFASAFQQQPPQPGEIATNIVTALLWLAAVSPLVYAAWEIGREHTAARRLNYELFVGLPEVFRRALRQEQPVADEEQSVIYARAPRDNPRAALVWGAGVGITVPAFFASFAPPLRTPPALMWLGVTGLLVGGLAYCRRRAMAYLREEPGRWDMFREYRLLNPARYDERGRRFVRWQIAGSVVFPIWWLGGGALILFSQ